ncbi:MAG: hypothetical protein WCI18_03955 [Pseudomonadota bacterium]
MNLHLNITWFLCTFFFGNYVAKGAPLRIGVEQSNLQRTSPYFTNIVGCSLSDAIKGNKNSYPQKTSKVWDIDLESISFQNGTELTDEQVKSSLAQASPIERAFLFSTNYGKNNLHVTFTLPISDPKLYLKWRLIAQKPSLYCGNWTTSKDKSAQISLEKEGQHILLEGESKEVGLERLKKNEIDIFIPETWTQIEPFLRKNPQVKPFFSKQAKNLYIHLNPSKINRLAQRQSLFESLRRLDLPFPFSKLPKARSSKINPSSKIDSDFTLGVPADVHWLEAAKQATASLLVYFKKPVIKVLDRESLFAEIKSGKLDAWVNDEELGYMTYHSQVSPNLYGPSGFSNPTLDNLIERAQLPDGAPASDELVEVLNSNGIMMKLASIEIIALISEKYRDPDMSDEKLTNLLQKFGRQ